MRHVPVFVPGFQSAVRAVHAGQDSACALHD